jgi:hypothetical protein
MTNRIMYDAVTPANIPDNAPPGTIIAVYRNGRYAADPAAVETRFPASKYAGIWIDVNSTDPANSQVLDVETGDATPADAPGWIKARLAAVPRALPTVYCNRSTIAAVILACDAAGLRLGIHYWFWISTLDGTLYEADGVVACQDQGGVTAPYDTSVVYADWWHCLPAPAPPKPVLVTDARAKAAVAEIVASAAVLAVYTGQG